MEDQKTGKELNESSNSLEENKIDAKDLDSDEEQENSSNQTDDLDYTKDENNLFQHKNKKIRLPRYSTAIVPTDKLIKIKNLKDSTEDAILRSVKNKTSKSIVKSLVSKKKQRFAYDGFDLDLTYITKNIIAMGYPSTSLEGLYRNPLEDVQKFFNTRHPNHYKIYNLCEEKDYPDNLFFKKAYFPFKDHEAPPLNLMRPFCEDAKKFLDEDEKNVIAVHCKAGKGRTGTLISCLLLYMNVFNTVDECLLYYGLMRVANAKGVTIPSQIRYVQYFEKIFKENMKHPIAFIKKAIKNLKIFTVPFFNKNYTPSFYIENNGRTYTSGKKKPNVTGKEPDCIFDFDFDKGFMVEGDVFIAFIKKSTFGQKEKLFKFWFNTNFIPNNSNIYVFQRRDIDKACKEKNSKFFRPGFKIELDFCDA